MKIKRLCRISALFLLCFLLMACGTAQTDEKQADTAKTMTYWAEGESRTAFLKYLDAITDESSPDYIPETDRIAVFDLDGTLIGEQFPVYFDWMMCVHRVLDDPDYAPTEEQLAVTEEILTAVRSGSFPDDLEEKQFNLSLELFVGLTQEEYRTYVRSFLQTSADRFDGLTLENAWFRTTVEAAQVLQENGFTVYICSGTDREADRVMIAEILDIPYRQVIGSDAYTVASGQGENGYLEYQYAEGDVPVRTAIPIIKNVKSSKPVQIAQEIGQKPVVAFGNSTGDLSMFMYTTDANPYRAIAFCVVPDDDTREVAYPEKAENLRNICAENGWIPISMKNDFVTIYGDDVTLDLSSTPWLDRMCAMLEEAEQSAAA